MNKTTVMLLLTLAAIAAMPSVSAQALPTDECDDPDLSPYINCKVGEVSGIVDSQVDDAVEEFVHIICAVYDIYDDPPMFCYCWQGLSPFCLDTRLD